MSHFNQYDSDVISAIGDAISALIFGPGEAKLGPGGWVGPALAVVRIPVMETRGQATDRQITERARDHIYN
jgi:hypothetical protein